MDETGDLLSYLDSLKVETRPDPEDYQDEVAASEVEEDDDPFFNKAQRQNLAQLTDLVTNLQESQMAIRDDVNADPKDRAEAAVKAGMSTGYLRYLNGIKSNLDTINNETCDVMLQKIGNAARQTLHDDFQGCYHGIDTPENQIATAKDVYTKAHSYA